MLLFPVLSLLLILLTLHVLPLLPILLVYPRSGLSFHSLFSVHHMQPRHVAEAGTVEDEVRYRVKEVSKCRGSMRRVMSNRLID